jgi:predicted negative regulator of RcsB-dependent stress response
LALDQTEEEQVADLKRWWQDNGTSLLVGVVIVLALMLGYRKWQDARANTAGEASSLYDQIAQLVVANSGKTVSDDDLLTAQNVYSQLKDQYASSIYSRYAAMMMAKFHVDKNELDQAAAELQWVLDNKGVGLFRTADPELFQVARQRLARVKLAKGDPQGALSLVRVPDAGSFAASYAETEGDALLMLGDREGAKAAYTKALQSTDVEGNPVVLRLKLQDLGVSGLGNGL